MQADESVVKSERFLCGVVEGKGNLVKTYILTFNVFSYKVFMEDHGL